MRFQIREFVTEDRFVKALSLDALYQVIPYASIRAALRDTGRRERRERKLNLVLTVCVVIALYLYPRCSVKQVLQQLAQGVRLLWGDGEFPLAGNSAISYRRDQVGVPPLALLCRRILRPLATPQTDGAFAFGLRLVALDGTVDPVPDTPANVQVFGRAKGKYGTSAFPQVRGVHLIECGTHAMIDCTFWPYRVSERRGTFRLLRSVQPDWLVMWDGGMHDFDLFQGVVARNAQVLALVPASVKPEIVSTLADGSQLAYLRPTEPRRRKQGEKLLVRLITYRLTDPARPGYNRVYRLGTTVLDPERASALDVIDVYHNRWEFELTMDEIETHQRLTDQPLRGLTPVRVLQELHGLVLAHFAVRSLMHEAAVQAGIAPTRLSFVHCIEVLREAVPEFQTVRPDQHPALRARLLRDMARVRLPARRLRTAPRVVKQRHSKYLRKREWDVHVPQPQKPFRECVSLII